MLRPGHRCVCVNFEYVLRDPRPLTPWTDDSDKRQKTFETEGLCGVGSQRGLEAITLPLGCLWLAPPSGPFGIAISERGRAGIVAALAPYKPLDLDAKW